MGVWIMDGWEDGWLDKLRLRLTQPGADHGKKIKSDVMNKELMLSTLCCNERFSVNKASKDFCCRSFHLMRSGRRYYFHETKNKSNCTGNWLKEISTCFTIR